MTLAAEAPKVHRRRRPTGEPPPLPRHLDRAAVAWLVAFGFWVVVWAWLFLFGTDDLGAWITERDLELMSPLVDDRVAPVEAGARAVHHSIAVVTALLGWAVIVGCAVTRRFRHGLVFLTVLLVTSGLVTVIARDIGRPRPLGVEAIGDWEGFAHPSRPIALLTVAAMAVALALFPAGRPRRAWYMGMTLGLAAAGFSQVYVGVDHPSDVIVSISMGVALSLVAFRLFAPEEAFPIRYGTGKAAHLDVSGARGEAIQRAMSIQLGVEVTDITPTGLGSSAGSTPLLLTVSSDPDYRLFAKVYSSTHVRSDRSYKLARTLLYGRLEDEQPFNSVRRLIQHEHYMLHLMRDNGINCPEPYGVIEITPEREYLLVMEFLSSAVESSEADVDDEVIDDALGVVALLWAGGIAHRDIKPANVMVQRRKARLIDVAFSQVRPSPWRQAADLANMLLVLALRTSPERVLERARRLYGDDELAEAFAVARGITIPSELRAALAEDGRDLLGRFREQVPHRDPVRIQRWSARRIALSVGVLLLAAIAVGTLLAGMADVGLV